MMTAEQFSDQWHKTHMRIYAPDSQVEKHWLELAEAYAAAQLAEKERLLHAIVLMVCDPHEAAKGGELPSHSKAVELIIDRVIAAEQRLQEAQGEITKLALACSERPTRDEFNTVRERLREREAELEQRWIAVGKQMPPDTQPVLFGWWNTPRGSVVSHYCVEIGMHRSEDGYWEAERTAPQDEPIRFTDDSEQVTHWQPLPSPPKEAK